MERMPEQEIHRLIATDMGKLNEYGERLKAAGDSEGLRLLAAAIEKHADQLEHYVNRFHGPNKN